ncbi:MAG: hypothetical protein A2005_12645 [Desulfuromonadales bacterium GWC2_61_20]|nr:MAG: hypothetical protein A2005_12645 [Desulfuromonadales bacterium GWC2_61_20]HBT82300.1 hypothetical protein [Desulfuromonas sp.]
MIRLVKIKFRPAGRHYDFNALNFELKAEDRVIVETDRGRALGIVVHPPVETPRSKAPEDLKSVMRPATEEDVVLANANAAREGEAARYCRQRIAERKMDMKLVRAEYLFDGSKIIFFFTADGRIDFRELVKDLAHNFHTRIEMRQIGVRDEAKLCGGLGICGRELCCSTFLTEFAPVSVKMAKEQGLALNPTKISGQCGRLLCCLAYEYDTYTAMRKCLPKCGRKVQIDGRDGEVLEQHVLKQTVTLRFEDGTRVRVNPEQIEKGAMGDLGTAPPAPAPGRRQSPGRTPRPERPAPAPSPGATPAQTPAPAPPGRREGAKEGGRPAGPGPRREREGRPQSAPVAKAPPTAAPVASADGAQPPAADAGKRRRRNRRRHKRPQGGGESP